MGDDRKAWLEVGKVIATDAKAQVTCPVCAEAILEVWDVPWASDPKRWERIKRECYKKAQYKCEICGGKGPKWQARGVPRRLRFADGGYGRPPVKRSGNGPKTGLEKARAF